MSAGVIAFKSEACRRSALIPWRSLCIALVALLLAACLMLEHVGREALADKIRRSISDVLVKDSIRTPDLGGKATTKDFAGALARRIQH